MIHIVEYEITFILSHTNIVNKKGGDKRQLFYNI